MQGWGPNSSIYKIGRNSWTIVTQPTDCSGGHIGFGTRTMKSILCPSSWLGLVAEYHDHLGWDDFLEGRICTLWVELQSQDLQEWQLECNTDYWACGLMCRLLEIVHQQWLYQNETVHMKLD
jgi:hypothetical protein